MITRCLQQLLVVGVRAVGVVEKLYHLPAPPLSILLLHARAAARALFCQSAYIFLVHCIFCTDEDVGTCCVVVVTVRYMVLSMLVLVQGDDMSRGYVQACTSACMSSIWRNQTQLRTMQQGVVSGGGRHPAAKKRRRAPVMMMLPARHAARPGEGRVRASSKNNVLGDAGRGCASHLPVRSDEQGAR